MNFSTPTLIVNKTIALNNLDRMIDVANKNNLILRPHFHSTMLTLISLTSKVQYLNIIILKELVLEITTTLIFSVIYMKLKLL